MSKVLTPENVASRPDASYFSPEKLAMLKRIFDSICKTENIIAKELRDRLAVELLTASKHTADEAALIAVAQQVIRQFRE